MTDKQLLIELREEFALFKKETYAIIVALQKENAILKERLAKYEKPKNSGNSSIAPSQDPYRKTKSLRERSNKLQGGQKGHKGSKLRKVTAPEFSINHGVDQCGCCGNNLKDTAHTYDARQVFDIPSIGIEVTP